MLVNHIFESIGPRSEFVVYKVTAPTTDKVYYGYCTGEENMKSTFLSRGTDGDMGRGDARMVAVAGGVDNLRYTALEIYDNEVEAFVERNDQRSHDAMSITGPSAFPGGIYQRALKMYPERVANWKKQVDLHSLSARAAMDDKIGGNPVYNYEKLKALVAANPEIKQQIMVDLDKLMYPQFVKKYFPQQ